VDKRCVATLEPVVQRQTYQGQRSAADLSTALQQVKESTEVPVDNGDSFCDSPSLRGLSGAFAVG